MNFGALIIGDEILSGKRQDGHFAARDRNAGAARAGAQMVPHHRRRPRADHRHPAPDLRRGDIVFSFGGIGATPDDHTRQCAAEAAGVPSIRHPEAVAEIEARFGAEAYPDRILMADLPQGSRIIPNPFNRIPGFFQRTITSCPASRKWRGR